MAVIEQPSATTAEPGWFADPLQEHNLRYYDGSEWTDHVTHYGPMPCGGCGHRTGDPSSS